jgi:hypothetical protein
VRERERERKGGREIKFVTERKRREKRRIRKRVGSERR